MPRPAAVAQVGGFRPPEDPLTSWMGTVKVAAVTNHAAVASSVIES